MYITYLLRNAWWMPEVKEWPDDLIQIVIQRQQKLKYSKQ